MGAHADLLADQGEANQVAAELANYLPLSFKIPKEQEYIEFLWDAFETNTTHGKYQFAFLAYHMLTMSFVYFNIWQIKQTEPKDFAMGLIGFGKDIEICLGFDLASLVQQLEFQNMRTLHEALKAEYASDDEHGAL